MPTIFQQFRAAFLVLFLLVGILTTTSATAAAQDSKTILFSRTELNLDSRNLASACAEQGDGVWLVRLHLTATGEAELERLTKKYHGGYMIMTTPEGHLTAARIHDVLTGKNLYVASLQDQEAAQEYIVEELKTAYACDAD